MQEEYARELIRRDTAVRPIESKESISDKTDKVYTYLMCPNCSSTLNKYDKFCRFCGQRIKEGDIHYV